MADYAYPSMKQPPLPPYAYSAVPAEAGGGPTVVHLTSNVTYADVQPDPWCGLVLGLMSLVCCCWACGLPAVVLSSITIAVAPRSGGLTDTEWRFLSRMSCVALVLGWVGLLFGTLFLLYWIAYYASGHPAAPERRPLDHRQ